jgi:outer membrane protein assembly factor BamC
MKRLKLRTVVLALGVSTAVTGCGFIAGLFPDKQKQYKYSTEIPPLEVPPDLTASTIEGAAARRGAVAERPAEAAAEPRPAGRTEREDGRYEADDEDLDEDDDRAAKRSSAEDSREAREPATAAPAATLAQSSDDVPLIEIEEPFAEAWNDVGKAIGRLKLELNDQNRSDGLYYVYFSEQDKPYEDRGFFGDIAAFFSSGPGHAKEYRVKLEEKGEVTYVFILGQDGKPQMDGEGLELLKRLHRTLQSLAEPQPADRERP